MATQEDIAAEYAAELVRRVRSIAKVGRHWRRNAWDILMENLSTEGVSVGEGGPWAAFVYPHLIELVIEYLGEHPDLDRFAELEWLVRLDLGHLATRLAQFSETSFTANERYMFSVAVDHCERQLDHIALFCPGTT